MNRRLKKAVGGLAMLAFLIVYVVVAVTIAGHLPDNRFIHLVYFVVAGVAWGAPLIPLLFWMEKEKGR